MQKALLLLALVVSFHSLFSQNVGIGTNSPAGKLDITSTNSGILIPRIALTGTNDVTTVPSHPTSTMVYNTATVSGVNAVSPGYYYWNGTLWNRIADVAASTGLAVSGDVTGTLGATTVSKINGVTLGSTTATGGNLLIGSGSSWVSTPVTGDATISSAGVVTLSATPTGNGYVKNQVAADQAAGFRITGNGLFNGGAVGIGTVTPNGLLEVKSSTAFDASTKVYITNGANDYGRTNLILTGRIQAGNDAWTFGSGARNSIVFAENAAASGVSVGAVGTEQYSMQLEGNSSSLGFLSRTNGATPVMTMLQSGNIGIGTTGPSAQLHTTGTVRFANYPSGLIATDATGTLTAPRTITGTAGQIDIANGTGISGNPTINMDPTYTADLKSPFALTGGGNISYIGSNFAWSNRFIVISNGNGSQFSTNGYFDITMPTSGTITGVGGSGNVTATASGIPMGGWQALYYILPIGSTNASVAANFRIASYTGGLTVPENWILLGIVNGDDNTLRAGNGAVIQAGQTWTAGVGMAQNSGNGNYIQNGTGAQSANFNITGNGTIGSTLQVGANGSMISSPSSWGTIGLTGALGGYYGVLFGPNSVAPNLMYDASGNGGFYEPALGVWETYYLRSNQHLSIGSSTDLGATLNTNGTFTASGVITARNGVNNDGGNLTLTGSSGIVNAASSYLMVNSKYAIDATDSWLRLNQQGSYSSGTYTPGFLRADGGITSGGLGSGGAGTITASNLAGTGNRNVYADAGGVLRATTSTTDAGWTGATNIMYSRDDINSTGTSCGGGIAGSGSGSTFTTIAAGNWSGGVDDGTYTVNLGFTYYINGTGYTQVTLTTNGVICFGGSGTTSFSNGALPNGAFSMPALCYYWDDLYIAGSAQQRYATLGDAGNMVFVLDFTIQTYTSNTSGCGQYVTGQVMIHQNGPIHVTYASLNGYMCGQSATIGLQVNSTTAVNISSNTKILDDNQSYGAEFVSFSPAK